ncbi:hypothetical protein [Streptomyces anandii]|uniref:hypothetical protein n=1 Tax=Streptomyces anandii TaxID=285454 RepID=UPI00378FF9A1
MNVTNTLAPYVPGLKLAAEAEQRLAAYRSYAHALGLDEASAEAVLKAVRAKAERMSRPGFDLPLSLVFGEARRCLILHASGLPYLPFMAYAEPLLGNGTDGGS